MTSLLFIYHGLTSLNVAAKRPLDLPTESGFTVKPNPDWIIEYARSMEGRGRFCRMYRISPPAELSGGRKFFLGDTGVGVLMSVDGT